MIRQKLVIDPLGGSEANDPEFRWHGDDVTVLI